VKTPSLVRKISELDSDDTLYKAEVKIYQMITLYAKKQLYFEIISVFYSVRRAALPVSRTSNDRLLYTARLLTF